MESYFDTTVPPYRPGATSGIGLISALSKDEMVPEEESG
jgi:hypothetical protein